MTAHDSQSLIRAIIPYVPPDVCTFMVLALALFVQTVFSGRIFLIGDQGQVPSLTWKGRIGTVFPDIGTRPKPELNDVPFTKNVHVGDRAPHPHSLLWLISGKSSLHFFVKNHEVIGPILFRYRAIFLPNRRGNK